MEERDGETETERGWCVCVRGGESVINYPKL